MTTAISVPFRIDANGAVATVSSTQEAAEAQILDVLMTHLNERVMRPAYGANLRQLLFDVNDAANRGHVAMRAKETLQASVTEVIIRDVAFINDAAENEALLSVTYMLIPYAQTFQVLASLRGIITEESFL